MIKIEQFTFKSRKDLEAHTLNVLKQAATNLGTCVEKNTRLFDYFHDILKNHPRYDNISISGVKRFILYSESPNSTKHVSDSFITKFKRNDNKIYTFSWVYCCLFVKINPDIALMRKSAKIHMDIFKKTCELKCMRCGSVSKHYDEYKVEYKYLDFDKIKDMFLKKEQEYTVHKQIINNTENTQNSLQARWIKYHASVAVLHLVCCSNYKSPL